MTADIINLSAFMAVAKTGSFTQAAKELHITQPAVSKRIANLEADLNVALLQRRSGGYILSAAGQLYLPYAEAALEQLVRGKQAIFALDAEMQADVQVTVSYDIGFYYLPAVLNAFHQNYDGKFNLCYDFYPLDSITQPNQKNTRLAIGMPITIPDNQLITKSLWRHQASIVVGKHHSLASQSSVTLLDLSAYPAILGTHKGVGLRQQIELLFHQMSLPLSISKTLDHTETVCNILNSSNEWSVVPNFAIKDSIVALPIHDISLYLETHLSYRKDLHLTRAEKVFVSTLETFVHPEAKSQRDQYHASSN